MNFNNCVTGIYFFEFAKSVGYFLYHTTNSFLITYVKGSSLAIFHDMIGLCLCFLVQKGFKTRILEEKGAKETRGTEVTYNFIFFHLFLVVVLNMVFSQYN